MPHEPRDFLGVLLSTSLRWIKVQERSTSPARILAEVKRARVFKLMHYPLLWSLLRDALSLGSSVVAISHTNPRSTSKYSWTIRFRSPAI